MASRPDPGASAPKTSNPPDPPTGKPAAGQPEAGQPAGFPASEAPPHPALAGDPHVAKALVKARESATAELERRARPQAGAKAKAAGPGAAILAGLTAEAIAAAVRGAEDTALQVFGDRAKDFLVGHHDWFSSLVTDRAWALLEGIAAGMQQHAGS
jgi:hypothetical protein